MTRLFYCFLAVVLALNLTSCATPAKNPIANGQSVDSHVAPQGMGTIYIYRNQFPSSATHIKLVLDEKDIGFLGGYSHIQIDVSQGRHKIKAVIHNEPSEIEVDVVASNKYFIKHQVKNIISFSLVLLPQNEAISQLVLTKPVSALVVKADSPNSVVALNGFKYEGFSSIKDLNGHGRIIYPEGNDSTSYEGEILRGKPAGRGVLMVRSGNKWEGDFKDGQMYSGTKTDKNGVVCEGDFLSWKIHGRAVCRFPNGNIWTSDFVQNKATGKALVTAVNGSFYEGDVRDWLPEGMGKLTTQDYVYEGVFKQGKFDSGKAVNNQGVVIAQIVNGQKVNNQAASSQYSSVASGSDTTLTDILSTTIKVLGFIGSAYSESLESRRQSNRQNPELLDGIDLFPPKSDSLNKPHKSDFSSYKSDSYTPANQNNQARQSNDLQTINRTSKDKGCTSDFDCGYGNTCVKERFTSGGVCMKSVDNSGRRVYNTPTADSIGVRTSEGCRLNTDCPVGFSCDETYRACVKR